MKGKRCVACTRFPCDPLIKWHGCLIVDKGLWDNLNEFRLLLEALLIRKHVLE